MAAPERIPVEFEDEIIGRILHPGDLLEDDLALELEILRTEEGLEYDVGEDIKRHGEVLLPARGPDTPCAPGR